MSTSAVSSWSPSDLARGPGRQTGRVLGRPQQPTPVLPVEPLLPQRNQLPDDLVQQRRMNQLAAVEKLVPLRTARTRNRTGKTAEKALQLPQRPTAHTGTQPLRQLVRLRGVPVRRSPPGIQPTGRLVFITH